MKGTVQAGFLAEESIAFGWDAEEGKADVSLVKAEWERQGELIWHRAVGVPKLCTGPNCAQVVCAGMTVTGGPEGCPEGHQTQGTMVA